MSGKKKQKVQINLDDEPVMAHSQRWCTVYPKGPQLSESTIKLLTSKRGGFGGAGLTFDELTLADRPVEHTPQEVDTHSFVTRRIQVKSIAILSAAMDTVTERKMALAMAQTGGVGIIHNRMSATEQAEKVNWVRKQIHYGGMIENPVTFLGTQFLSDLQRESLVNSYHFSSFPICDGEGKLMGVVSRDSLDFILDDNPQLSALMTPVSKLTTASSPITTEEAFELMNTHKVKHLPVLSKDGKMVGLYSWNDVKACFVAKASYGIDVDGHFIVGAAVGCEESERARVECLREVGCKLISVEGGRKGVGAIKKQLDVVREVFGDDVQIIAGNVASYESAMALLENDAKPDAIKVGMGAGALGTTRLETGHGVPQVSAIFQVWKAVKEYGDKTGYYVPIVADGGCRASGDIVKAIAVGASSVMLGSLLGGCDESPGLVVTQGGRKYKTIRGLWAQSGAGTDPDKLHGAATLGVAGLVPAKGRCSDVIAKLVGGVQSGFCHTGAQSVAQFQATAKIWKQSTAGVIEGMPHDITDIHD